MKMRVEFKKSGLLLVSVLLLCLLIRFGLRGAIVASFATLFSLACHELGHVAAAFAEGVKVKRIGICLKGTYIVREQSPEPLEEAIIATGGLGCNLLLAAIAWPYWRWLGLLNLVLFVSNALPFAGSDGQRVLRSLGWRR
jgi:Zn-dependent protease